MPGSVVGIATGYGLEGPWIESGGGEIFRTCPYRPWGPPSLLYNGYRVFLGVKSGRGVTLTPHPLLVPWLRKSRAIPLLPHWAVRPVQSLSACTGVHFYIIIYCFGTTVGYGWLCGPSLTETSLRGAWLNSLLLEVSVLCYQPSCYSCLQFAVIKLWPGDVCFGTGNYIRSATDCLPIWMYAIWQTVAPLFCFLCRLTLRLLMSYIYIWSTYSWCF